MTYGVSISSTASVAILCLAALVPSVRAHIREPDCLKCESVPRDAPKYRVARKARTTKGGLIVWVSIRKEQFTPSAIRALACRFVHDFAEEDLLVLVFDNFNSAKNYRAPWEQEKPPGWETHVRSLRASYVRDVHKNEHWIWWDVDREKTQKEKIDICPPGSK